MNRRSSDEVFLYNQHGILVDRANKEVVMRKDNRTMLDDFRYKAHVMQFCAVEHLVGRVLND